MRIAIIAPPWLPVPPPGYGGTEVVLDGLARGLVDAGHDVLLIGHPESKCAVKRLSIVPAEDAQPMGRAVSELEHALGAYEAADRLRRDQRSHDGGSGGRLDQPPSAGRRDQPQSVQPWSRGDLPPRRRPHRARGDLAVARVDDRPASRRRDPPRASMSTASRAGDGEGGYLATLTRMTHDKGVHRAAQLAHTAGVPLRIAAKVRTTREHEYFDECVRPLLTRRRRVHR